jgi:hypothetical protein
MRTDWDGVLVPVPAYAPACTLLLPIGPATDRTVALNYLNARPSCAILGNFRRQRRA